MVVGKDVELKIASSGRGIIQVARPRVVIASLQLGLGLEMNHYLVSRYLINTHNAMKFCSHCHEVRFFKFSDVRTVKDLDEILHHIADSVVHDICTLDGKNTSQGRGIITSLTPVSTTMRIPIPRINSTTDDIEDAHKIRVVHHKLDDTVLSRAQCQGLKDLQPTVVCSIRDTYGFHPGI
ncbi:hypothetical protein QYM36_002421 [Artemia franciscana]|uniref:Uncharacterized protein n=1 Tax=Artemia franciscana TaxID=6661 RepID=A0AA88LA81_ARTSF|nr:hypothetical protein QYM36_002421 [Artemia franciscana]